MARIQYSLAVTRQCQLVGPREESELAPQRARERGALAGKRIGVPRAVFLNDTVTGNDAYVNTVFEGALDVLRALGATVVDPADLPSAEAIAGSGNETVVLDTDFKVRMAGVGGTASDGRADPAGWVVRGAAREPVGGALTGRADRVRRCAPGAGGADGVHEPVRVGRAARPLRG